MHAYAYVIHINILFRKRLFGVYILKDGREWRAIDRLTTQIEQLESHVNAKGTKRPLQERLDLLEGHQRLTEIHVAKCLEAGAKRQRGEPSPSRARSSDSRTITSSNPSLKLGFTGRGYEEEEPQNISRAELEAKLRHFSLALQAASECSKDRDASIRAEFRQTCDASNAKLRNDIEDLNGPISGCRNAYPTGWRDRQEFEVMAERCKTTERHVHEIVVKVRECHEETLPGLSVTNGKRVQWNRATCPQMIGVAVNLPVRRTTIEATLREWAQAANRWVCWNDELAEVNGPPVGTRLELRFIGCQGRSKVRTDKFWKYIEVGKDRWWDIEISSVENVPVKCYFSVDLSPRAAVTRWVTRTTAQVLREVFPRDTIISPNDYTGYIAINGDKAVQVIAIDLESYQIDMDESFFARHGVDPNTIQHIVEFRYQNPQSDAIRETVPYDYREFSQEIHCD